MDAIIIIAAIITIVGTPIALLISIVNMDKPKRNKFNKSIALAAKVIWFFIGLIIFGSFLISEITSEEPINKLNVARMILASCCITAWILGHIIVIAFYQIIQSEAKASVALDLHVKNMANQVMSELKSANNSNPTDCKKRSR